jgi:hypothetical protein
MWIDWKQKIMKFPWQDKEIILSSVRDNITVCPAVSDKRLKGPLKKNAISHWIEVSVLPQHKEHCTLMAMAGAGTIPRLVQDLLSQFRKLFAKLQSLPRRRVVDHQIPLIHGAQPLNVRLYRYSPHQKNEIERQVSEMLRSGVIQLISSPFASSVLLVTKKIGHGTYVWTIGH